MQAIRVRGDILLRVESVDVLAEVALSTSSEMLWKRGVRDPFGAVQALQSNAILHLHSARTYDILKFLELLALLLEQTASRLEFLHRGGEMLVGLNDLVRALFMRRVHTLYVNGFGTLQGD
mgnify:CR=1 FL=1